MAGQQSSLNVFAALPLIAVVVIIYNITVFTGVAFFGTDAETSGDVQQIDAILDAGFSLTLISGSIWKFSYGDFLLVFGLGLLLVEVIRATKTGTTAIINHSLSLILFVICLIEFIVIPGFGTSVFFILMLMTLFDVTAGFTVGIVAARRDFGDAGRVL